MGVSAETCEAVLSWGKCSVRGVTPYCCAAFQEAEKCQDLHCKVQALNKVMTDNDCLVLMEAFHHDNPDCVDFKDQQRLQAVVALVVIVAVVAGIISKSARNVVPSKKQVGLLENAAEA